MKTQETKKQEGNKVSPALVKELETKKVEKQTGTEKINKSTDNAGTGTGGKNR